jgi:predicted nucleic acid-binding protein
VTGPREAMTSRIWHGPMTTYANTLKATIASMHRAGAGQVMPLPDPAGAFPATLLPLVWPLVLDTHTLGNDLARSARSGRTILVSGAIGGALRLYCPRHVVREIYEYMTLWAQRAGRPLDDVAQLWVREYLPILRVVDVPNGLLYPDEAARVRVLATSGHPHGDPDDVPTAQLGLLLDAPVLSKDKNLLRAVYGDQHDIVAHGEWLDTLRAGGDAGPLGEFLMAGYMLTAGIGIGSYRLIARTVKVFGWALTVTFAGLGTLGVRFLATPETKAKVMTGVKTVTAEGWELLQTVLLSLGEAQTQVEAMAPKSAPFRDGYVAEDVLTRVCIHNVARARSGHVSAERLNQELHLPGVPHGEATIRKVLRGEPAFVQVYKGRFQLGRALVCSVESEPP